MCYDDYARPPQPDAPGGTVHSEDIVLTATDGTPFAAYISCPDNSIGAQIMIYPDARGLHQFYKELAIRFAEMGIAALAIDYFGRTAGVASRDDSFDYMTHVQQLQFSTILADASAGLAYLRTGDAAKQATFTVGFCMGGGLSLLTATEDFGLAGVIGFYAGMSRSYPGKGTLLDQAENIKYPVLGLFGGADQGIPVSNVETLDKALDKAGVEHEIVIYPGATHSFFDRRQTEFANESADAWKRVLAFIAAHNK